MKVISFNANGIRSAARKGFFEWLSAENADFVCLQEVRAPKKELISEPQYFPKGYYCEYVDALKKGYSGVAIYAKDKPLNIIQTLGFSTCDEEGRYLQFDHPRFSIMSLYMPSGTSGDERQTVKFDFLERFALHLQRLKATGRELILCGDFNIAHQNIDIKNWRANQEHSGFLPEERAWLDALFGPMGFVDAFRLKNKEPAYTWWSHRGRARANNVGWRIDYQVITPGLVNSVSSVRVYNDQLFSDHAPVVIEYR